MAHNPILNAYLIELKPIGELSTFKDFCKAKFFTPNDNPSDAELFSSLFANFLKELGGEKLVNDKKSKKVLGIQRVGDGEQNQFIHSHFDSKVIEGVIDGGKYGISREVTDIENNQNREELNAKKAILDKYYFYLYTPFNSKRGVLFIQSYTEETIQQPFKDFLQVFFSCVNHFYNLIYDNCIPERVVKEFVEDSEITMFKYKTILPAGNQLRKQIESSVNGFEVTIEIKPILENGKVAPKEKNINGIWKFLSKKKFEKVALGAMKDPTVFVKNNKRNAHFDIAEQIASIKPTVYLEKEGVEVNPESGIPNFVQVKETCEKIKEEIIPEIAKKLEIDEF